MRFALILTLAACGGGDAIFDVSSEPDSISIDVSADGASDAESMSWENRGARAEVSMSLGNGATGEVVLRVRDDAGTLVLDETIADDGTRSLDTLTEAGGEGGTWEVEIRTQGLDGNASISLDRYWP
ncbi:MAG: hypothetical protein EP330_11175 [Deltaproteobacteria bacterium]|nr:MAG: hypothetical protein EP330_11175 [Deltaproteobacteria bacterium]